jgi:TNF receptor-associated factor 4
LAVYCANKDKGCDWQGILKDFLVKENFLIQFKYRFSCQIHIETCGLVTLDCPNECGIRFERRFMTKHQTEDCSKRTVVCEFCKTNIIFEDEIPHFNVCTEFKVPCPNQCTTQEFTRGQVN